MSGVIELDLLSKLAAEENSEPVISFANKCKIMFGDKFEGKLNYDKISKNDFKKKMTFEEAGLEFLKNMCNDIESIPNLPEYYSNIEKSILFPVDESKTWNKVSNHKRNKKDVKSVETIVKKGMIIVSADPQLGKTNFIICQSIKSMIEGRTPIIVTRALTGDMNKLDKDIEGISIKFNNFMNQHNINDKKFDITIIRGDKLINKKEIEMLNKSINKEYPRIIITLGNECQLSRIYNLVENYPSLYDLLIDEIDYVDYGADSKTSKILMCLKQGSYQTFGITATPLDAIFSEEELKTVNMVRLKRPENYRGFAEFEVRTLEKDPETVGLSVAKSYAEILNSDKNLNPFLKWFSKKGCASNFENKYPRICLIKNSHVIENQNQMYDGILNNYNSKFVVIVYNGEGIRMNYTGMKFCIIAGKTVEPNKYIELSIPDVLQYLKDNGGTKKFPRIIIISGKLAGRCISYVSRDYEWHLTDMYYNPAKSTPIPEMIQSAGRLCGRNRGKAPHLILHTTERVADALYNGFHFTTEVIARAIATPLMEYGEEINFKQSILSVPMNNKKFPKGRNMTSKVKINKSKFNLVKKDDGGVEFDKYKYELYISKKEKVDTKSDTKVDDTKINNDEIIESLKEIGKEEYQRLIGMFSKWSKGTSKIAVFMQHLDPLKIYNEKEIKELCKENCITNMSHLMIFNREKSKGYGMILQKNNYTYSLHKCLISEFNKYFN